MVNLRLLARHALDPRLVCAQLLEAQADALYARSDDLLNDSARLRGEALALRQEVEMEHEIAEAQADADRQLAAPGRGRGIS